MYDPCSKVAGEASLLCYQQVVAESCEGIPKAAKLYRLRTDNCRDQVPISIEKVYRTSILDRGIVQSCGDGDVVPDGGDGRAEEVDGIWGGANECPEELAGGSVKR